MIIVGRERAGKSSLAKILFRDFYEKSFVPVLIKGEDISSLDLDKFEKIVQNNFLNHYKNPKLPLFNQLDRDQTCIIIDDFDHLKFTARGRLKLLTTIHKRYERVYVFCDDFLKLEELADAEFGAAVFAEYTQLEIREFGHFLRSKLIHNWCALGAEYVITESDLECKVTRYESLVDNALSKSYLPSFPFFVLTLLQSVESSITTNVASYGHLCEVLITQALAISHKVATLNTKRTYLAEIAYQLFMQKSKVLTEEEFGIFHAKHCSKFNLNLDREPMFRELEQSSLLARYDGQYRFKYPYYYFYFVALHLRDHLEEQSVKSHVEMLSTKLHKEENANIWLFLSHLSKNPLLVELILKQATSLFSEIPVPKFDEDISFFKAISERIPSIVLVNRKPSEIREQRRRQLDANQQEPKDVPDEESEQSAFIKYTVSLNAAVRTMDVLGQIVRNFAGSLVGPVKYQIVDECYHLGLRIAGSVLTVWKDAPEKIITEIVDLIVTRLEDNKELKDTTRQELADLVRGVFFFLCEYATFGMIKRISHSVGATELIPTFREVLEGNPTNAYKLVDISIKLDTLKPPTKELVDLKKDFRNNLFCDRLLRRLVVDHLYLFPTDYKTRQQICEAMGIPIKEVRDRDLSKGEQKRLPTPGS